MKPETHTDMPRPSETSEGQEMTTKEPELATASNEQYEPDLSTVDPFDPSRFRRNTLAASVGAQGVVTRCPLVKVPSADQFIRASCDPAFSDYPCTILELPSQREEYLMVPNVADQVVVQLPKLVKDQSLTLCIDRQGNVMLWRFVPAEAPNGDNSWHASKRLAVAEAQRRWVRVESGNGGYDCHAIKIEIPDPVWPNATMRDYLKLAFGDRIITDVSHPVVQRLLGLAA